MFQLCRQDKWLEVYESVRNKPWLATTPMIMDSKFFVATSLSLNVSSLTSCARRRSQITLPQPLSIKPLPAKATRRCAHE